MQRSVHPSERVLRPRHKPLYIALTIAYLGAIAFLFLAWASPEHWHRQPFRTSALFLILALPTAAALGRWLIIPQMRRPLPRKVSPGLKVAVLTTYVPGAEPIRMLELTLRSIVEMKYPHDSWLLDEGDSAAAKELCGKLKVRHFSRLGLTQNRPNPALFEPGTKHGNYNCWLHEVGFGEYDVIVAFDPDHSPDRDFLGEVLPYFDDPHIGYVQAPQAYYNQAASFIAAGAAEETYDFNSTIQMAAYGMGYPLILGCHNAHRVTALREVGGFAPHDADDLMLTMLYRNKGWRGVYVPKIMARGITPVDWNGYLGQQRRWARSVLHLKVHIQHALNSKLSLATKVASYLQGLAYLLPGVLFPFVTLLLLMTIASGRAPLVCGSIGIARPLLLVSVMTACYFYRQQFFLDPSLEKGIHLRALLLRLAKAPVMLLAMVDVLLARRFGYVMTPKTASQNRSLYLIVPFAALALTIAAAWIYGTLSTPSYPWPIHVLAIASLSFCILLIATDFFRYPDPFDEKLLIRLLRDEPSSAPY